MCFINLSSDHLNMMPKFQTEGFFRSYFFLGMMVFWQVSIEGQPLGFKLNASNHMKITYNIRNI